MEWARDLDENSSAYKFAADNSKFIRVIAGPGTGKSFGLKRRIARLIENGQDPKRILAVTFTRTSAQDLMNEIHSIGIAGAENVVAKTLHGFCFGLLHKKNIIESTGRLPRPLLDFEKSPMLCDINTSESTKSKEKRLKAFEAAWARLQSDNPGFPPNETDRHFENEIQKWLKDHKAMLLGEMIIEAYHYLRNNPHCPERHAYDHVLVDEYQDLNKAEQSVIDLLASNGNLAIIGDDDQSIYSFKYANPEGIRTFPENHPACNIIDFDHCRRCPKKVVSMASRLISKNTNRTLGDLHAFESNQEGMVEIVQWPTLENEINGLSAKIYDDINSGYIKPEDVLVLTPRRLIAFRIRDELIKKGINAKSYFRESALSSKDLNYSFSLLTMLANPQDLVALRYLLGFGAANYRSPSYKKLTQYCKENNMDLFDALEKCSAGSLFIPGISSILKQYEIIKSKLHSLISAAHDNIDDFINILANDIPENNDFRSILSEAIETSHIDRESDIHGWLHEIYAYSVEKISFPDDTNEQDHIRIMSLHASKGLSAKYVIVMSTIDEFIPSIDTKSDIDIDMQIEEQRRLFYVAITRCKSSKNGFPGKLIISSFSRLPGAEALHLNIIANPNYIRTVSASRFIRDFENTAPTTTATLV